MLGLRRVPRPCPGSGRGGNPAPRRARAVADQIQLAAAKTRWKGSPLVDVVVEAVAGSAVHLRGAWCGRVVVHVSDHSRNGRRFHAPMAPVRRQQIHAAAAEPARPPRAAGDRGASAWTGACDGPSDASRGSRRGGRACEATESGGRSRSAAARAEPARPPRAAGAVRAQASQSRRATCTRGWLSRSKCPARGRCSSSASGNRSGRLTGRPEERPYADGWRTRRSPRKRPTG